MGRSGQTDFVQKCLRSLTLGMSGGVCFFMVWSSVENCEPEVETREPACVMVMEAVLLKPGRAQSLGQRYRETAVNWQGDGQRSQEV